MRPSLKKTIVGGRQDDGGLSIKWSGCLSGEGHLWGAEVERVPQEGFRSWQSSVLSHCYEGSLYLDLLTPEGL